MRPAPMAEEEAGEGPFTNPYGDRHLTTSDTICEAWWMRRGFTRGTDRGSVGCGVRWQWRRNVLTGRGHVRHNGLDTGLNRCRFVPPGTRRGSHTHSDRGSCLRALRAAQRFVCECASPSGCLMVEATVLTVQQVVLARRRTVITVYVQ
jgi:hypothetical protein